MSSSSSRGASVPTVGGPIDAHILLRDGKVFLRKRCSEHGRFEALVYADADAYVRNARYNKPGTIPLSFSSEVHYGCPYDCGLCPEHQQHVCLGIIEVNSACNMDCPRIDYLTRAMSAPGRREQHIAEFAIMNRLLRHPCPGSLASPTLGFFGDRSTGVISAGIVLPAAAKPHHAGLRLIS